MRPTAVPLPAKTALVKAAPVAAPIIVHNPEAVFDDRMSHRIHQEGQGLIDQKLFQIQKTKDGWRACAMWNIEGTGEIPAFVKKLSCNLDIFNDVFNLGLRMNPEIKVEATDGGLFARERAEGDTIGNMIRKVIGNIRNTHVNLHFGGDEEFIEEEEFPMT
jgi:hypothetical protein